MNTFKNKITDFSKGIETTSYGTSIVSHFDISEGKLKPVNSFKKITSPEEDKYGIVAITHDGDRVFGLGNGISNWLSKDWKRRIKISTEKAKMKQAYYINFSHFGDEFWNHIKNDGSDIRIGSKEHNQVDSKLVGFNKKNKKGGMFFNAKYKGPFYVYYDNQNIDTSYVTGTFSESNIALLFDGKFEELGFYNFDWDNDTGNDPSFEDGIICKYGKNIVQETDEQNKFGENSSFIIETLVHEGSRDGSFFSDHSDVYISKEGSNITAHIDAEDNVVFTESLEYINGVCHIVFHHDNKITTLFINGIEKKRFEFDKIGDNDIEWTSKRDVHINTQTLYAEYIFADNGGYYEGDIPDIYKNRLGQKEEYWKHGGVELFEKIKPEYSGIQIYTKKNIYEEVWKDYTSMGNLIKENKANPIPSFFVKASYRMFFLTSQEEVDSENVHQIYLGMFDPTEVKKLDATYEVFGYGLQTIPTLEHTALQEAMYFPYGGWLYKLLPDGTFTERVFDTYGTGSSIGKYNSYYLAVAGTYRNKCHVEVYDFEQNDPVERFDLGKGEASLLINIDSSLISLINNFIDKSNLADSKSSLDIRLIESNGTSRDIKSIDVSTSDKYDLAWQKPITNLKINTKKGTLFYAELIIDGVEMKGLWILNKYQSENGSSISLSLFADTSHLGTIINISDVGNHVVVINENHEVHMLSQKYNQESVWTSGPIDDGEPDHVKKIAGYEIATDELEKGQVVKVFIKTENSDYKLILEHTGEGKLSKEIRNGYLPTTKKREYKIVSVGGGSAINHFGELIENTNDKV